MKKETTLSESMNEVQLADKMIKILKDSKEVTDQVKELQSKIEMKDRLHADFRQLKGKEKWLKLMIQKTEDSIENISSGNDLEKYQRYLSELPVVTKKARLLQKRIDPNHNASIDRDIKYCKSDLGSAIQIALSPTADEMQQELDELTDSFLKKISTLAHALIRVKIKQDLVHHTNFPHSAISPLIPKIHDFSRLEIYAEDFHMLRQAIARNNAIKGNA